jgi:hypothetical protein
MCHYTNPSIGPGVMLTNASSFDDISTLRIGSLCKKSECSLFRSCRSSSYNCRKLPALSDPRQSLFAIQVQTARQHCTFLRCCLLPIVCIKTSKVGSSGTCVRKAQAQAHLISHWWRRKGERQRPMATTDKPLVKLTSVPRAISKNRSPESSPNFLCLLYKTGRVL